MSKTIMLIHGAWLNAQSWEGFKARYEAKMTKAMYEKQKNAPSKTELKVYPDRSHWTCMEPGWEQVADDALEWATNRSRKS